MLGCIWKSGVEMDGGVSEGSGRTETVTTSAQGAEKELKLSLGTFLF